MMPQRSATYMDYQGVILETKSRENGLSGFRAHPREIMTEVLKALQELNVCWKKISHYNMTDKKPAFGDYILKENAGGDRSGR
ncbi:putative non-specific serine/threonine protein kinase [Helianthus annuus]|nr:putative non-specific serine/threonine protein kinase [Helianthus annuus]